MVGLVLVLNFDEDFLLGGERDSRVTMYFTKLDDSPMFRKQVRVLRADSVFIRRCRVAFVAFPRLDFGERVLLRLCSLARYSYAFTLFIAI